MNEISVPLKHNNAPTKEGFYLFERISGEKPILVEIFKSKGEPQFFLNGVCLNVEYWSICRWSDALVFNSTN